MIVSMSKITLLGMEEEREDLIKSLMNFGAVEINTLDAEDYEELADNPVVQEDLSSVEAQLAKVHTAIDSMNKYCPEKKGLFQSRRVITISEFEKLNQDRKSTWGTVDKIKEQEEKLTALKAEENKFLNLQQSLAPWKGLTAPLEAVGTHKTNFQYGTIPSAVSWDLTQPEFAEKFPFSVLERINSDKDQHYIYFITHTDSTDECLSFLKARGYSRVTFQGLSGTIEDNIRKTNHRIDEITSERETCITQIKELSQARKSAEVLYDALQMEKGRIEAAGKVLTTKRAFYITGWVPERHAQNAKKFLESKYTVCVELEKPAKDEEFPVLLENKGIAEAGEPVSGMYSLPNSLEIDPNAVMSPFFIMFAALMLGDGGYGIILALATGFVLWRFKLEDGTRKFVKVLFYVGLGTIFWGIVFGSWFGISGLVKYALWFDMVAEPERMLSIAFLFGIIHLYAGFLMKAANLIRDKKYLDALFDVGFWLIYYTGAVFFLLPYAPEVDKVSVAPLVEIGKYLFVIGAVLVLATSGRNNKYIATKFFGGLYNLYNIVGFLSDILSYSRLLALGLATAIIGSIVNDLAFMFDMPVVLKIIFGIVILLIGHTINFAINLLGAYVHSCRLQYLEFFGKFFTGGGVPFSPLKANTKYITVKADAGI